MAKYTYGNKTPKKPISWAALKQMSRMYVHVKPYRGEFAVGLFQCVLGMDSFESRIVDERKQHISEFIFHFIGIRIGFCFELTQFFLNFFPHLFGALPIETDTTRFVLNPLRFDHRR